MLKLLCILVDVQQRYAALKLRLVKRDHVPQSALAGWMTGWLEAPLVYANQRQQPMERGINALSLI